jgi:hypothetical protein
LLNHSWYTDFDEESFPLPLSRYRAYRGFNRSPRDPFSGGAALLQLHIFISDFQLFSGLSITEETLLVKMRIWCIKIGNVLVLHFTPWVEASAGGL